MSEVAQEPPEPDRPALARGFAVLSHDSGHKGAVFDAEMAPTWASFYILCPIPGTEQYDDFMAGFRWTIQNGTGIGDW